LHFLPIFSPLIHFLLALSSDPPGVKVRAVNGLHGIDYLAESSIAKKASYVFGHVINALIDVGYDYNNLEAAAYDWRLPPSKVLQCE